MNNTIPLSDSDYDEIFIYAQNKGLLVCQYHCGLSDVASADDSGTLDPFVVFNYVALVILLPLISACGIVGNTLTIVTYTRPSILNSLNLYLVALACSDIVVLCTSVFMFTFESIRHTYPRIQRIYMFLITSFYPLGCIAHTTSIYITVGADIDCFFDKVLPERWSAAMCQIGTAARMVACVVTFSIAYNLVHFFEVRVSTCLDVSRNVSLIEACATPLRSDPNYNQIYYVYMYTFISIILPLVALIILTAIIVIVLVRQAIKERRPSATDDATAVNLAKMSSNTEVLPNNNPVLNLVTVAVNPLQATTSPADDCKALLVVVILFIICNSLSLIVNFLENYANIGNAIAYLIDLSNLLVVANSSFNFLIYCTFDIKFRYTLKHLAMVCDKCVRRRRPRRTANGTNQPIMIENHNVEKNQNDEKLITNEPQQQSEL